MGASPNTFILDRFLKFFPETKRGDAEVGREKRGVDLVFSNLCNLIGEIFPSQSSMDPVTHLYAYLPIHVVGANLLIDVVFPDRKLKNRQTNSEGVKIQN